MNHSIASQPRPEGPAARPARDHEDRAARRAEVTTRTVQIVLLCLGGLLLTAGLIVFTAVAWRQMGDGGRLTVLAGATGLLLAVPFALTRFRLWATAETLAATATLALWCSALAGYYLYLPGGTALTAPSVARWTALVMAAAVLYRAAARVSAPAWALLPIGAAGAGFAAFGSPVAASLHMGVIGAVLAGAAWSVRAAPTRHAASDRWSARALLAAGAVTVLLAALRAAFGLDAALLPTVAATACLLAAIGVVATVHARATGASRAALAALAASAAVLTLAAWVLVTRAEDPLLAVPAFALGTAVVVVAGSWNDADEDHPWLVPTVASVVAVTALAALGATVTGAYGLTCFAGAAAVALAGARIFPEPLADALTRAGTVVGAVVLVGCAALGLSGFPAAFGADPNPLLRWEIPAIALACAAGAAAVRRDLRTDLVAAATATSALSAGALLDRPWAPTAAFALVTAAAAVIACTSPSPARRIAAWIAAYLWLAATALAAAYDPAANALAPAPALLAATAIAASALAVLHLRARPGDAARAVARAGAHASAGAYLLALTLVFALDGPSVHAPLAFLAYGAALAVAALAGERGRVRHVLGACAAATAAQLLLTAYSGTAIVEWYTVPPAAAVFGVGLWMLRRSPETGSWAALAPAIALGFGPSLALALGPDGDPWRRAAVGACAVAVLLLAANRRWQAPLVLAAVVLTVLAVNEIALVWSLVPKWAPLSVGGAILIAAGATLEQRRRDLARLRRTVKAMR